MRHNGAMTGMHIQSASRRQFNAPTTGAKASVELCPAPDPASLESSVIFAPSGLGAMLAAALSQIYSVTSQRVGGGYRAFCEELPGIIARGFDKEECQSRIREAIPQGLRHLDALGIETPRIGQRPTVLTIVPSEKPVRRGPQLPGGFEPVVECVSGNKLGRGDFIGTCPRLPNFVVFGPSREACDCVTRGYIAGALAQAGKGASSALSA